MIVAIDGPAGSGKGTIAKLLEEKLGLEHIDTGAMYRCIALYMLNKGIMLDNINEITSNLGNVEIELLKENGKNIVLLNGKDVTDEIRTEKVNNVVPEISSIPKVREVMVILQRKYAENRNIVMEGRDIGTAVFPNADIKIYLDGSVEERAKRRYKENIEKGINISLEEVKKSIIARDKKDKTRKYGTLKIAEDAIVIDTTNLNIEQVLDKIIKIIQKEEDN